MESPSFLGWRVNARGVAKNIEWCKIAGKLVLITDKKSYMSFRLIQKSVTLNDLKQQNGPYFALFYRIWKFSGRIA